jgi:hypothetical protein
MVGCSDENSQNALRASLSGTNEVPATTTSANGTATFDIQGSTVLFRLELHSITGVTAAHIHSGAGGANGPIRVTLYNGPTTGSVDGDLVQATFTSSDVTGIAFNDLLNEMRNGSAYVNVHTTAFPAGEIRGQLQLE